jgi:hypothetical protein
LDLFLLLARLVLFLLLIEPKTPIVHQAADRRVRIRNNLDQIQARLGRPLHGIGQVENPDLLAVLGDQTNLWNQNLVVDAITFWCSDSRLPPNYENSNSGPAEGAE